MYNGMISNEITVEEGRIIEIIPKMKGGSLKILTGNA